MQSKINTDLGGQLDVANEGQGGNSVSHLFSQEHQWGCQQAVEPEESLRLKQM